MLWQGKKFGYCSLNVCRKGRGCFKQYTKQGGTFLFTRQAAIDTDRDATEGKMDVGKVTVSIRFTEKHVQEWIMLHRKRISERSYKHFGKVSLERRILEDCEGESVQLLVPSCDLFNYPVLF